MQTVFSPQLIERCQKIFQQRSGVEIDIERAEMILEQLAKLGLLIVKMKTKKGGEKYAQ